jgi:hypothetical protein
VRLFPYDTQTTQPCAEANPAIALWLQTTRPAGRSAELGASAGITRMKRIALFLILFVAGGILAYCYLPPSEANQRVAAQLSKVTQFNLGGTGYAGTRTDGERAFFIILRSRRAPDLFRGIFDRGTSEAKLYALCGLHATDRSSYKGYAARFAKDNQTLHITGGCIARDSSSSELVTSIESGAVENYIRLAKKDGIDK